VTFLGREGQTGRVSVAKLRPLTSADELNAVAVRSQLRGDFEHYAEGIWNQAQKHQHLVTAFNMDAPTERQVDVPVQQRMAHDPCKSLENAKKWSSKMATLSFWLSRRQAAREALHGTTIYKQVPPELNKQVTAKLIEIGLLRVGGTVAAIT